MKENLRPARFSALLFLTLFLAASAALSQGGPPFATDDPGTPGNQRWEVNLAFTVETRDREHTFETPLLDANYGLGDRIQLKVEIPLVVQHTERTGSDRGCSSQDVLRAILAAGAMWLARGLLPRLQG